MLHDLKTCGLSTDVLARLRDRGIVTLEQFLDTDGPKRAGLNALLGKSAQAARRVIDNHLVGHADLVQRRRPITLALPPITGVAGPSNELTRVRSPRLDATDGYEVVLDRLDQIRQRGTIPSKMLLTKWMMPIIDQGMHGTCVGMAANAAREMLVGRELSPGFVYRLAKALDGLPDIEGSWQVFAMEGMAQVGDVLPRLYSYRDALSNRPIQPLFRAAKEHAISGYADLMLPRPDFNMLPLLLKAVLAGKLSGSLGPQPVNVSMRLHRSYESWTTISTGLMSLPLPGEAVLGGHAMVIVGYIDASDPDGLFGINYFVVRNSCGEAWAADNPLGLRGHALVPESYFQDPNLIWEALICLAEPSPAKPSILGVMPGFWRHQ